jgi:hypothetical protein
MSSKVLLKSMSKAFYRDFFDYVKYCARYAIGATGDFLSEIQLSNKTEPPSRNTGKPGMDLYPLEFLCQVIGLIWLILDFRYLNFENTNQNSGVEQLQSGQGPLKPRSASVLATSSAAH